LCGQVRYEAEIDPKRVVICHCTDCQTHSGTSFRTIVQVEAHAFRLTQGSVREYVKQTSESGNPRRLAFCPQCGSAIFGGPGPGEQGPLSLRVGGLRQREELAPRVQLWARSALPWLDEIGSLPRIDTQPAAAPRPRGP